MISLKIADEVVEEITKTLSDMKITDLKLAGREEQTNVQMAICSAFYHNLCVQNGVIKDRHSDEIPVYTIVKLRENATIFPGSSVTASETPKWFVYQEFVKTSNAKSILKNITPITPDWVKTVCPPQYLHKFNVENIQQKVLQSFEMKLVPAIFQALQSHDITFLEQQTNTILSLNKQQCSIISWALPSEWNQVQKMLSEYFGIIKERLAKEVQEVVIAGKTRALVGPGGSIVRMLLPSECVRVIVTNIPLEVYTNVKYHAMLQESFEQFGKVLSVDIRSDSTQCWGSITYQESVSVTRSVKELDGKTLPWFPKTEDPHYLSVKADTPAVSRHFLSFQENNVTVVWRTGVSQGIAYVVFETPEQARAALTDFRYSARLDTKHAKDQQNITSIYLSKVPLEVDEFDIKEHYRRYGNIKNHWIITKPSVEDPQDWASPEAINILRGILENCGEIELFEVVPPGSTQQRRLEFIGKAFVRFKDGAAARRAVAELDGKLNLFGTGKLRVISDFSYDFTLTGQNYKVLHHHIKTVMDIATTKCKGCRISVKNREDIVLLRVQGQTIADIVEAKSYIDQVLQMEALPMAEGINAKYFLSNHMKEINDIQRKSGISVQYDKRSNLLQLIGPTTERREVAQLLATLSSPNNNRERTFTITLPKGSLKAILGRNGKGLFYLQKQFHVEANLIIPKHLILVKSTEEEFLAFKKAVDELIQNFIAQPKDNMDKDKDEEECGICFCEFTQPFTLLCGHSFCKECLGAQIKNSLHSTEFPINCVACNAAVALSDLFALATSDELRKLNQGAVRTFLLTNKNYSNCLTPDCPQIFSKESASNDFICDVCMRHYCIKCKVQYHLGFTCEEQQRILNSDKEFEEWKKNNTKPCPKCNAAIQKNGGCNHMTCSVCKAHFCWHCLFSAQEATPIYDHLRTQHGGIYD